MRRIYKYDIPPKAEFSIKMPEHGRILHLDIQNHGPRMWVAIDTNDIYAHRNFWVVGTGEDIPEDLYRNSDYIGTYLMNNGTLVFHLFERGI